MLKYAREIACAAQWLREADALLITAGAGMGVDSGLPDFRGPQGFWKAYPALRSEQIEFQDIANGMAFIDHPRRAWGFYGHRLQLYRATIPHAGFSILSEIAGRMPHGAFVFTSNVDGQFQKAGFAEDRIVECHGSIHYLQCHVPCSNHIWPAEAIEPHVEHSTCSYLGALPSCPHCGQLARPNILMFNDWNWLAQRTDQQHYQLHQWLGKVKKPVVIELGAGTAIPSVRIRGESLQAPLIRINPREPEVRKERAVGIALGALPALKEIHTRLG